MQFWRTGNTEWKTERKPVCRWTLAIAVLFAASGFAQDKSEKTGSARAKLQELRRQRAAKKPNSEGAKDLQTKADVKSWLADDDTAYIDRMLDEEWKAAKFTVSDLCTDGEFIRRATLDIIGRVPTLDETQAFVHDKAGDRRARLIERLLDSPEYGKNFANVWTNWMITDGRTGGGNQNVNPPALHAWLEKEFNHNSSWDGMVRQLIAARGRWEENGAVNFIVANNMNANSTKTTSYMTRLFLCVQTQCTECHDHPWNEWKQDQFHGLNAFFTNTRERRVTKLGDNGQEVTDYYELLEQPWMPDAAKGAFFERRNGLAVFTTPMYIDGRDIRALVRGDKPSAKNPLAIRVEDLANDPSNSTGEPIYLREILAKVITDKENKYFARAAVNRLWHHFMGHSFIKNVDDFDNGQDEPTMPELLDTLAREFRETGHDQKRLIKWICTSRAYSLSSKTKGKPNDDAVGFFTAMLTKPMTPEQIYDSVMTLTQIQKASSSADTSRERAEFVRQIVQTFSGDEIQTSAPKFNGTITQALMLMNSQLMQRATSCTPGSFLHRIATDRSLDDKKKIEALFKAAYSRNASGVEIKEMSRFFQAATTPEAKQNALSDVLWVLLNSSEFMLNH